MADGQGKYVEGLTADGKSLERMSKQQLEEYHRETMKQKSAKTKELNQEDADLNQNEDDLQKIEQDLNAAKAKKKLAEERSSVSIDTETKGKINRLVKDTINTFVQIRGRRDDEEMVVDVQYLPGHERTGLNIHIGGEGAGSLHARFKIRLNQLVEELAEQAARYWGLDKTKVFFLDRDSRIVPDKMKLSEIILPPPVPPRKDKGDDQGQGQASSSTALVPASGSAIQEHNGSQLYPVLEGRNYKLILVRAGTVLVKEDLRQPKGEVQNDFTFDQKKLEEELQNMRKKHGDTGAAPEPVNIDDIPSLFALLEQGKERKHQKKWDNMCRIAELIMLLFFTIFFFVSVSQASDFPTRMQITSSLIEEEYLEVKRFNAISTFQEYIDYVDGPLKKSVVVPNLNASNLFTLAAVFYEYKGTPTPWYTTTGLDFCDPPATASPSSNTSTVASTNGTNSSRRRLDFDEGAVDLDAGAYTEESGFSISQARFLEARFLSANSTNGSNVTAATAAPAPACIPYSLRKCRTHRAIEIMKYAMENQNHVPICEEAPDTLGISMWSQSLNPNSKFSFVVGEMSSYSVDTKDPDAESTISEQDDASYLASVAKLKEPMNEQDDVARMVVLYIYSPSINGFMIYQLLIENPLSGTFLTRVHKYAINLERPTPEWYTIWSIVTMFALAILLMELRRILGWPKRLSHEAEEDRGHFSCSTILVALLFFIPVVVLALHSNVIDSASEKQVQFINSTSVVRLSDQSMKALYLFSIISHVDKTLQMIVLMIFQLLLWKFALMFLPQLQATSDMIKKLVKPMLAGVLFIILILAVFLMFFMALFSNRMYECRNIIDALLLLLQMAIGGVPRRWQEYFKTEPVAWTALSGAFIVLLHRVMKHISIAIMVSFKHEKDLYENHNFHKFWVDKMRQKKMKAEDFNPAEAGWIFDNVADPKNPEAKVHLQ